MEHTHDAAYWEKRYQEGNTPWDIGYPNPTFTKYFEQITNKEIEILIPGAGNAYEAEWLITNGFKNVYICDWSITAIQQVKDRLPELPDTHFIVGDYFKIGQKFDYILEQTFFCALPRDLRVDYIEKTYSLLKPQGRLLGLLFAIEFPHDGPPHGGSKEEYQILFEQKFKINPLEIAKNSIQPRQGKEFYIDFYKE